MAASVLYSLIRLFLDVAAPSRQEQTKLQAEVLVLRRQVQVLDLSSVTQNRPPAIT